MKKEKTKFIKEFNNYFIKEFNILISVPLIVFCTGLGVFIIYMKTTNFYLSFFMSSYAIHVITKLLMRNSELKAYIQK